MKLAAIFLIFGACALADQTAPGTSTRPILTNAEAAAYDIADYLQGWTPETISTSSADYVVGTDYSTIQAAVNAAIRAGGTTRKYIQIPAGRYAEVVYVPNSNVPLTIYGAGSNPSDTVISLAVSATLTGTAYVDLVGHLFSRGDPAYNTYQNCASRSRIGTSCSTVFFVQSSNVQLANLTIENASQLAGTDQAVALQTTNDRIQVSNARLLGHQDTLCSGNGGTTLQRSYISNTYIEGDIDFVFGGGSTVFENVTFYAKSDRRQDEAVIFAPDTDPNVVYGYLAINCVITGDSSWSTSKHVYIARSWDNGLSSASDYVAGVSPNGQLVVRDSVIDGVVTVAAPYTAATSGRAYSGDASSSRNVDDNANNRFYEYNNSGDGA